MKFTPLPPSPYGPPCNSKLTSLTCSRNLSWQTQKWCHLSLISYRMPSLEYTAVDKIIETPDSVIHPSTIACWTVVEIVSEGWWFNSIIIFKAAVCGIALSGVSLTMSSHVAQNKFVSTRLKRLQNSLDLFYCLARSPKVSISASKCIFSKSVHYFMRLVPYKSHSQNLSGLKWCSVVRYHHK